MSEAKKGFLDESTNSNDFNKLSFIIRQTVLGLVDTCFVGIVKAVNEDNTVDVLPIVNGVDGNGKSVERSIVFNLPYLRHQGGVCKVDIMPAIGDIGLVCLTKEDSSSAIEQKSNTVPPTDKKYNKSNGIYIASIASTCEEAKHSLTIREEGITIDTAAKIVISCGEDATVNVGGNLTASITGDMSANVTGILNVSSANAEVNASSVVLNSSSISLGGSGGKKVALDGDSVVSGGTVVGVVQATSTATTSL